MLVLVEVVAWHLVERELISPLVFFTVECTTSVGIGLVEKRRSARLHGRDSIEICPGWRPRYVCPRLMVDFNHPNPHSHHAQGLFPSVIPSEIFDKIN